MSAQRDESSSSKTVYFVQADYAEALQRRVRAALREVETNFPAETLDPEGGPWWHGAVVMVRAILEGELDDKLPEMPNGE